MNPPATTETTIPPRLIALDGELVRYAGDGNSALVLRQLFFWWLISGRAPFYKFNDVCTHPCYRPGDSWLEETGLTRRQFESARQHLAVKIRRGTREDIVVAFATGALAVYWTDGDHKTWYAVNEALVQQDTPTLYTRYLTEKKAEVDRASTNARPNKAISDKPGTASQGAKPQQGTHLATRETPSTGEAQQAAENAPSPNNANVHRGGSGADGVVVHRGAEANSAVVQQPTWEADGAVVHWIGADGAVVHQGAVADGVTVHQQAEANAASVHQPMAHPAIGLIPETYPQKDLPETEPDLLVPPPSLPAVPSGTERRQEEGGEAVQSVSGEIALIQQALEARGVYADPARRVAERAFRLGVGERAVLACFEAHLTALERDQVSNPVGAVVWRLLHRPLVLPEPPGRKRRRSRLTEAFFGEEGEQERVATEVLAVASSTEVPVAARALFDAALCPGGATVFAPEAVPAPFPPEAASDANPERPFAMLWLEVLRDLQGQMTRATFERWFPATCLEGVEAGVYLIHVPDQATCEILTHRLGRQVQRALAWQAGEVSGVRFVVSDRG